MPTLVVGATVVIYNDINYQYNAGVYYQPVDNGYRVIIPPPGITVASLPTDAVTVSVGGADYFYYGGIFYLQGSGGYQVVRAPAGAIVYNLPDGCKTITANNVTYLQYGDDYFMPIQAPDGQPAYEVVEVE